jgi:hypothetical protein
VAAGGAAGAALTRESAPHDRQGHGKADPRPDDEALEHRAEQERQSVGADDADPGGAELDSAAD